MDLQNDCREVTDRQWFGRARSVRPQPRVQKTFRPTRDWNSEAKFIAPPSIVFPVSFRLTSSSELSLHLDNMTRKLRVAAAQVGRIDRTTPRFDILSRLVTLLEQAASQSVKLVVFPETTFAAFFPRYLLDDEELGGFFEKEPEEGIAHCESVKPFFDKAKELGVDVVVGYGEAASDGGRYNSASYVSGGKTIGKYRCVLFFTLLS
jgi:hypothetical protein